MQVRCWGTRGSIPTPGPDTVKYGGNTTCLEVILFDQTRLVFDAGTGIKKLGDKLVAENSTKPINLFLTHAHWDHIQGFPFFQPVHSGAFTIRFFGSAPYFSRLWDILRKQMESEYFPVNFDALSAKLEFNVIYKTPKKVGSAKISYILCNHPGGCTSFKVEDERKTLVFMTDNELSSKKITTHREKLLKFCRGADLLIHDAQFTPAELKVKSGWGHSSYLEALEFALEAGVKNLFLFHHDPDHSDDRLEELVRECRQKIQSLNAPLSCFAAQEGEIFNL